MALDTWMNFSMASSFGLITGKTWPQSQRRTAVCISAPQSGHSFTGATPSPGFFGLWKILLQLRGDDQRPCVMQLPPRSMMVNASFTGCGRAPRPHIWSHKGIDAVALFTMTVSISGWSNPVVAIPMLLSIASGVLANHWSTSERSGESASRCRELNPALTKAALTAIECSTLQLKIMVLRPSECCL